MNNLNHAIRILKTERARLDDLLLDEKFIKSIRQHNEMMKSIDELNEALKILTNIK